jgi:PAS domain S-box-containing protein
VAEISLKERFGGLLETAGQLYWEVDLEYRVIFANGGVKRIFGNPVGRICHEFMAGSGFVCMDCPVRKVFRGAPRATSERKRSTKEGRAIWLQHTATPMRDRDGKLIGAAELMIDVTPRKTMEADLQDSERRYRSLVEEVPDIIFSLDDEGRFTFVNTRAEAFLGRSVDRILDTRLSDYVDEDDRPRLRSLYRLKPDAVWDEEIGMASRRNGRRFARIRCKASFDREGRLLGFEGVMRDTTERRKLEEELRSSRTALMEKIKIIDELYEHVVQTGKSKAIEEHTAEVAHELRQPLAIVGGFARRMARKLDANETLDTETQKQYVEIIVTEIKRLERILDSLIDFTKRGAVRLQKISPNDLIKYIVGITEGRRREKGIRVETKLGPEIGEVPLDPGRFQQLVLNLLSNAIEASPRGGVVEIETGASIPSDRALKTAELESDSYFEMKIRNNGPKIPPEELNRIYTPFFTTKSKGTGLGLTVSKKIVEDHGGTISAKSDDKGTVFTIWLPMEQRRAGGSDLNSLRGRPVPVRE